MEIVNYQIPYVSLTAKLWDVLSWIFGAKNDHVNSLAPGRFQINFR